MKNNKGYVNIETIVYAFFILIVIGFIGYGIFNWIYSRTAGNKTTVDLKYNYTKAIIYVNGKEIQLDIDTWSDYEGEQIQIISKDGTVYLVSSFNTILIGE